MYLFIERSLHCSAYRDSDTNETPQRNGRLRVNDGTTTTDLVCIYRVGQKNVPLYFCPYLRQLLTDFQNSFTDTLCRQFAIMWLLYLVAQKTSWTFACVIQPNGRN